MEKQMISQMKSCKKHGIDASLKVTTGLPAEEILKVIKNQNADLIVMAKTKKTKRIQKSPHTWKRFKKDC